MTTTTKRPRKVLTERQYDEICRMVSQVASTARYHEDVMLRTDLYSADERTAARAAYNEAFETVVRHLAALTKWNT